MSKGTDFYIGLMSGTSIDGIDAALIDFSIEHRPRLVYALSHPIPAAVRAEIAQLCQPGHDEINRLGSLDRRMGVLFAEAATSLLSHAQISADQVRAIGSHGQTIRHHPSQSVSFTMQIGDPNTIAFRSGITTVADFRRMDIAAGGQGAPLVPAFHDAVLRHPLENRVVVNIGGMANVSVLAQGIPVSGFDTGPGNILMDEWIQNKHQQPYDKDGQWAATGRYDAELLDLLLSHMYFQLPPPKSTGREMFHIKWLETILESLPPLKDEDVQRTLLEFTALSIAQAIEGLSIPIESILLCGGGVHNSLLRSRIRELLPASDVKSTTEICIHADWLEAIAFAWLAKQRLEIKSGNVPAVTGAERPCILGGIYQPY